MSTEADEEAPEKWWTTLYGRSLSDFERVRNQEHEFFRSLPTVEGLCLERQKLAQRLDWMLLLSLLGAVVMIAGGLPKDGEFSIFGIQGPNQLISLQLIGVGVAGVFSRYWQMLISITMLGEMISKIIGPLVGDEHVDFVIARYDATYLWFNLTRQRGVGYQSAWPHKLTALTVPLFGLMIMILHSGIVIYALWQSIKLALAAADPSTVLVTLSFVAMGISLLSVFLFVMGFMVPQPFKMSVEMREFLAAEKSEKAAAAQDVKNLPGLTALSENAPDNRR